MDYKLNRQIGYFPKEKKILLPEEQKSLPEKKKPLKKEAVEESQKPGPKPDSKSVIDWLENHPLINKAELCREVGCNRANFDKYVKSCEIPEKHFNNIVSVLKSYGYGI